MGKFKSTNERITETIIEALERGTVPWKKPWKIYDDGMGHRNLVYNSPYRGINAFLTNLSGFESPFWATYKQVTQLGGQVKKGEKGTMVTYWGRGKDKEDPEKGYFFLKSYTVFNVQDQCEGIDVPEVKPLKLKEHERIEKCEAIVKAMPNPPKIQDDDARAFYRLATDTVGMPRLGQFNKAEEYYSTLFHELIHSTGHKDRVDRKEMQKGNFFGDSDYSKEELIAEMGAAFLCAEAGIEQAVLENSAAYIKSWLRVLRGNTNMVAMAATQAQKASNFILNVKYEEKKKEEEPKAKKKTTKKKKTYTKPVKKAA